MALPGAGQQCGDYIEESRRDSQRPLLAAPHCGLALDSAELASTAGSLRREACTECRDSFRPQEIEASFHGPWAVVGGDDNANAHRQL